MVTGMASKYEEWGARVRIGASAGSALCPFTVIQWKPPANHMTRMMIFRIMSTSLEKRSWMCDEKHTHTHTYNTTDVYCISNDKHNPVLRL